MPSGLIGGSKASALTRAPNESKSTHGGRRAGAGRPPAVGQPIRRTVYLDQRHIDQIKAWGFKQRRLGTFSELLRDMLDANDRMSAVLDKGQFMLDTLDDEGEFDVDAVHAFAISLGSASRTID